MKIFGNYNDNTKGIIKDFSITILLFIFFYYIDLRLAFFMAIVSTSILLTRRVIISLNPGYIKGHKINYKGKEFLVPKGIDVFTLTNSHSMESLYNYIEVIRGTITPPEILIIRFNKISQIRQFELLILNNILKQLKTSRILIIFSDVNANIQNQFRQNKIASKIGEENIFYYITDALQLAKNTLEANLSSSSS